MDCSPRSSQIPCDLQRLLARKLLAHHNLATQVRFNWMKECLAEINADRAAPWDGSSVLRSPLYLLPDHSSTLPPTLNAALRVSVGVTVVPDYFAFADLIPGRLLPSRQIAAQFLGRTESS